jgi:hypothetical protein
MRGKYANRNDIALLKLRRHVKFRYRLNTEKSILPICWSSKLSGDDVNKKESVYVAGWGNTNDNKCVTDKNGPDPYSQCKLPFTYKGMTRFGCSFSSPPSNYDHRCKLLSRYVEKRRKGLFEKILNKYGSIQIKRSLKGYLRTETDCYSQKYSKFGWCATCNPEATRPEDPGYCQAPNWGRNTRLAL